MLSVQNRQKKHPGKTRMAMYITAGLLMTLAAGGVTGLTAEIREFRGAPALFINGKPEPPFFFYANATPDPERPFLAQAALTRAVGIRFYSFSVPMPWPGPGEDRDFSRADQAFETLLGIHPEALCIPRFSCMPPAWWLKAHPEDAMLFSDGERSRHYMSVASEAWRTEMRVHLRAFIRHCETRWGDHVIGYHPCGLSTAEWFYGRAWEPVFSGLEGAMEKGFREWAMKKYGSADALAGAWRIPEPGPETVFVPALPARSTSACGLFRDARREQQGIDFQEYQQAAVAEALERIAACVKAETARRKLVVFFYGYTFELAGIPKGPAASGHMLLGRILDSPDTDVLCSPVSYGNRGPGGISGLMPPVDSIRRAGKLYLAEDDTRTWRCDSESPFAAVKPMPDREAVFREHRRLFGHLLPRRMAVWHMDLAGAGWLNDAGIWRNIENLKAIYAAHMENPVSFEPEIAVFADEESAPALAATNVMAGPHFSSFRNDWYRIGAPAGIYLLRDLLAGRVEAPALSIFIGCWRRTEAERVILRNALAGKTAVWLHGSGFLGENGPDTANMTDLTGFDFEMAESGGGALRFTQSDLTACVAGCTVSSDGLILRPRWNIIPRDDIEIIGRYSDGSAAAGVTGAPGCRSIYIGATVCPAGLLRHIARTAGAHIYAGGNAVVSADDTFLSVSVCKGGEKRIHLPAGKGARPLPDGEALPVENGVIQVTFEENDVRLFELLDID
jgi:beta-galactosidase